jgi:hypothetical protein
LVLTPARWRSGSRGRGNRRAGSWGGWAVPPGRDAGEGTTSEVALMLESMEVPTRRSVMRPSAYALRPS